MSHYTLVTDPVYKAIQLHKYDCLLPSSYPLQCTPPTHTHTHTHMLSLSHQLFLLLVFDHLSVTLPSLVRVPVVLVSIFILHACMASALHLRLLLVISLSSAFGTFLSSPSLASPSSVNAYSVQVSIGKFIWVAYLICTFHWSSFYSCVFKFTHVSFLSFFWCVYCLMKPRPLVGGK